MKQKYLTLKLYLLGLTAGLFIFGWAAITRADSAPANTATAGPTTQTTVQLQAPSLQPIPSVPRFRTRTS